MRPSPVAFGATLSPRGGARELRYGVPSMITPLRFALACRGYAEIVDRQIAAADVREIAAAATRGATKREEIVDRLLARVEAIVHYAVVEVSDGSTVPRLPTGVLKNEYGDCKDKATLLVALLRAAGLPAHVALLFAGHGFEVRTHRHRDRCVHSASRRSDVR